MTGFSYALMAGFPEDGFETAERLYREGEFAQAEQLYSRIESSHPNYPQALLRLGTIYYATGRPALAERSFQGHLRFHQSPEVYCLLAGAQFNQKKFTQAYESAKQAIRLDRKYAKAYTALGMVYTAIDDWPDARASFQEALRLNPQDSDTWFMMGRAYFLRNDFPKAKDAFENALRLDPHQVRTYENLALTLDVMNKSSAAERVYLQGIGVSRLQKHPDARVYVAYAVFLSKQNRAPESLAQFREAVRVTPRDADARYELANQLFRMKQWAEAAQEGEMALRETGSVYRIHYLLARIYTAMGQTEVASKHAQEAARLADKRP